MNGQYDKSPLKPDTEDTSYKNYGYEKEKIPLYKHPLLWFLFFVSLITLLLMITKVIRFDDTDTAMASASNEAISTNEAIEAAEIKEIKNDDIKFPPDFETFKERFNEQEYCRKTVIKMVRYYDFLAPKSERIKNEKFYIEEDEPDSNVELYQIAFEGKDNSFAVSHVNKAGQMLDIKFHTLSDNEAKVDPGMLLVKSLISAIDPGIKEEDIQRSVESKADTPININDISYAYGTAIFDNGADTYHKLEAIYKKQTE